MESIAREIEKLVSEFAHTAIDAEMEIITHVSQELAKTLETKEDVAKALRNMFFLGQVYKEKE